jgi:hypothetical protein
VNFLSSARALLRFMFDVHILEAERYGELVTYQFTPLGNERVSTWPSYGSPKTMPRNEAARLWRSLRRKGWTIQEQREIPF